MRSTGISGKVASNARTARILDPQSLRPAPGRHCPVPRARGLLAGAGRRQARPVVGIERARGDPLALASTVPVAFRSRRPLLAAAIVIAANAGCLIAAAPHQAAFQPFVALTLDAYSVGSRFEGPYAILAPCVLGVLTAILFAVAFATGQQSGNLIPSPVWLAAAWAVGRVVRSWRRKAAELERLNPRLGRGVQRERGARQHHRRRSRLHPGLRPHRCARGDDADAPRRAARGDRRGRHVSRFATSEQSKPATKGRGRQSSHRRHDGA
jgi:hypothetical protein